MTLESIYAEIDRALAGGDMNAAAAIAAQALSAGHRNPYLLNMAAWGHEEAGEFAAARALLDEALAIDPADPLVRISLGAILRKEGRNDEAVRALSEAIPLAHDNPSLWLERAYAYDASGEFAAAAADYTRAIDLDPRCAPAMAGKAAISARRGEAGAAIPLANAALAIEPANVAARIALARCAVDSGDAASAEAQLTALLARRDLHPADAVIANGLLGDARHRLGDRDGAFRAYRDANAAFADIHGPGGHTDYVEALDRSLADIPRALWAAQEPAAGRTHRHAFLLGYPRSGTTLVENVLASLPGVFAVEERPTLRETDIAYFADGDGLAALASAGPERIEALRSAYWERARGLGLPSNASCFVDMDPLKGVKLPAIARLFPDAKIVAMRRDPRDVVWSCFKTQFAPTAAAREFTSVETAARHYDALMRYTERCFATLPLDVHILRYEALIADFDDLTWRLSAFLGLKWSADVRRFDKTAARRGVATASAGQVRRGLYDGGGQWRPYAEYLEPAMPILKPWIDKFGYEA